MLQLNLSIVKQLQLSQLPLVAVVSYAEVANVAAVAPQPLYNTIFGVQANFRVNYPNRVITRVKCIVI